MRKKYNIPLDQNKIWFLNEYEKSSLGDCQSEQEKKGVLSTLKNIKNFMYKVQAYENARIDKTAVFDLPKKDFLVFLCMLGCPSQECLSTYLTILKQYRQFANIHGLSRTNIDYIQKISFGELWQYLDTEKVNNRYLTKEEVLNFVTTIDTLQDRALFMLVFEGVNGIRNKHLINLKKDDIDLSKGTIKTEEFTRVASKELLQMLPSVYLEKDYGTVYQKTFSAHEHYDTQLVDSDYVIRPTVGYVNQTDSPNDPDYPVYSGEHVLSKIISARFYRFTKEDEKLQHTTITTLYNSGVIHRAIQTLGEDCNRRDFVDYCVAHENLSNGTGYKLFIVWMEVIYPKLHNGERHPLDSRPSENFFAEPIAN